MRNKILATALLLTLPLFLSACTINLPGLGPINIGGKTAPKAITLNVWGLWEKPEVMDMLISKYKETHPNVTINYDDRSVLKLEDYKETVYTRAAQPDSPDIIFVHNSWVPGLHGSLAPAPDSIMNAATYGSRFYDVATKSAVFDNKVYGLPLYYDGLVLVYNKKHFEEIDQKIAPTAWEEFRRVALALTVKGTDGKLVRAGAAIGTSDNIDFATDILGLMFAQAGVNIPDDLESKPATDALTFYTNFYKEDKVWDNTFPEASTAFAQEKVSMIFIPTWNLLDIVTARPDMSIGVAPVPQARPSDPAAWGSFWMSTVSGGSKNKEAAWEFIKWMSDNDQQLMYFSENSKIRKYGAPYSTPDLKSNLEANVYLKPALDVAPFAVSGRLAARSGNKAAVEALRFAINKINDPMALAKMDEVSKEAKEKIANTK